MAVSFSRNDEAQTVARNLQQTAQDLYSLYERLCNVTRKIDSSWTSNGEDKTSYIDGLNKSAGSIYQLVSIIKDTGITSENYATDVYEFGHDA